MIIEKLQDIMRDILDDADLTITENTSNEDLVGWDSLATISLIVAISEEFNIHIDIEDFEMFKDVKSIIELINRKLSI